MLLSMPRIGWFSQLLAQDFSLNFTGLGIRLHDPDLGLPVQLRREHGLYSFLIQSVTFANSYASAIAALHVI